MVTSENVSIVEHFQSFYLELIEVKRLAHSPVADVAATDTIEILPDGGRAELIWRKAAAILDRQSQTMIHAGPLEAVLHRDARFIMAALADEVFVHPRWEGTDYWLSHLLETRLFHTHSAGEVFFTKLNALLAGNDPSTDSLAVIYLMALALGFRGKYAGAPGGEAALRGYRRRLYDLIQSRNPTLLGDHEHLFPNAYLSTVYEGVPRWLPAPGRWVAISIAVVLGWLLVAWVTWEILTADVKQKLPEAVVPGLVDQPRTGSAK